MSAAAVAAAAAHFEETRLVFAILGTAFIYWLAHLHARTVGDAVKHQKRPTSALKEALAETSTTRIQITVAQYAKEWSATRPHRSTTATRVKSMIDNHITGTRLGGKRLSAVRTSEVQAWVTERSQTLSPGTMRLVLQTLRSISMPQSKIDFWQGTR
jgi:hypothetical protein